MKATARPAVGKGAARAERRAGRVPGVIYGNNQPPVTISVDDADLRQRILAGRFLTTIYDIDLEGKKHRVIPRDFHLDPVRDFPLHVDFMRLGEGATIRVSVPLHIQNAEAAPGVKRGGTVNIVTHTIDLECSVDNIPQYVEADVSGLEISYSLHLSDIKLPPGVKSLSREDVTLVTIVPPSGYAEEHEGGCCGRRCCRCGGRLLRLLPVRLRARRPALLPARQAARGRCEGPRGRRKGARRWRRQEEVMPDAGCRVMRLFVGLGNPGAKYAHNRHNIGFMAVDEIARRHGFAPWRRRFQGETAEGTLDARAGGPASSPLTFMNEFGRAVQEAANFFKLGAGRDHRVSGRTRTAAGARCGSRSAAASPAITACVRSPRISATTIAACGSGSAIPASRNWCTATCCPISPRAIAPGSRRSARRSPITPRCSRRTATSTFQNKVHLAMQGKGFFDKDDDGAA